MQSCTCLLPRHAWMKKIFGFPCSAGQIISENLFVMSSIGTDMPSVPLIPAFLPWLMRIKTTDWCLAGPSSLILLTRWSIDAIIIYILKDLSLCLYGFYKSTWSIIMLWDRVHDGESYFYQCSYPSGNIWIGYLEVLYNVCVPVTIKMQALQVPLENEKGT